MTIELNGRIDSGNAAQLERDLFARLEGCAEADELILDAARLEYVSSAGLRVILRLKKAHPSLKITNVSSEVYEILEMTGFTEMMCVQKAYRVVSVEGCEVVGEGFNGKVYRIDRDNVVKTYKNADALSEIQHEREVARLALILGVPTAISYDVVRVGDSYGSVFELLNARSFAKILADEPERIDWCVDEYVKMLNTIHGITVPEGKLPSAKQIFVERIERIKRQLPDELGSKLEKMIAEIPESRRMLHGDYHTKNIVLAGDEVLLIDMDTLCVGDPIFELAQMYNSYVGFSEYDHNTVLDFQGYDHSTALDFWKKSLAKYLGTADEKALERAEEKIRCVAYTMLVDWSTRHSAPEDAADAAATALWRRELVELLERVDSLRIEISKARETSSGEVRFDAAEENLPAVLDYIGKRLDAANCPAKTRMQIELAVEEVFVNIAKYAYAPNTGSVDIRVKVSETPASAEIVFIDGGIPYDPLKKPDPDVTLSADEREAGGLGIFMTKNLMDDVSYERSGGKNILTLKKNWRS